MELLPLAFDELLPVVLLVAEPEADAHGGVRSDSGVVYSSLLDMKKSGSRSEGMVQKT